MCVHKKRGRLPMRSLVAVSVAHFCFVFVNYYLFAVRYMMCFLKPKHTQKPHTQNVTWSSRFPPNNYFSPVIKSVFYNGGQSKHIKTFCGIVWAGFVLCLCWLWSTWFCWTYEWVKENQKGFAYPTALITYYENSYETKTVLVTWNCFCRISHLA